MRATARTTLKFCDVEKRYVEDFWGPFQQVVFRTFLNKIAITHIRFPQGKLNSNGGSRSKPESSDSGDSEYACPGSCCLFFLFFPIFFFVPISSGVFAPPKWLKSFGMAPKRAKTPRTGKKRPFRPHPISSCRGSKRARRPGEQKTALRVGFGSFGAPGTEKLRFSEPHGRFFLKSLRKSGPRNWGGKG